MKSINRNSRSFKGLSDEELQDLTRVVLEDFPEDSKVSDLRIERDYFSNDYIIDYAPLGKMLKYRKFLDTPPC